MDLVQQLVIDNVFPRSGQKSIVSNKMFDHNINNFFASNIAPVNQPCNNSPSSTSNSQGIITVYHRRNLRCLSLPGHPQGNNTISIPDPRFEFLHLGNENSVKIMASTNGLVCLSNFREKSGSLLYVCNPATKQGYPIPSSSGKDSVGLAFDPSTSPHHYKLVHSIMRNFLEDSSTINMHVPQIEYQFEVFSSCSTHQNWVKSNQKVLVPKPSKCLKPVFAKGIVYRHCGEYLLWFDCDNDNAGYISLPSQEDCGLPEIGVNDGRVTCTQVTREDLKVWELDCSRVANNGAMWEMTHCMSLDKTLQTKLAIRITERTLKRKRSAGGGGDRDRDLKRLWLRPLPFEGGDKVYVKAKLRPITGKIQNHHKDWKLIWFDLKEGNATEKCLHGELLFGHSKTVFGYANSSVPLPDLCYS